mmetsp:Transcript_63788/g.156951  ORF Transcript_63788/g.156951 Transcript_63788/m.156951 type:complete len:352 (-) Transcript_63788:13-1068(-)
MAAAGEHMPLQDNTMDNTEMRRNRPSAHVAPAGPQHEGTLVRGELAAEISDRCGLSEDEGSYEQRRINLLLRSPHENLASLKDNGTGGVAEEAVDGCSLEEIMGSMAEDECLSERHAIALLRQALLGIECLHENRVTHGCLDTSNVLIEADTGTVKLCNVGGAPKTPLYLAPEAIQTGRPEAASDIWSVGCIVVELLSQQQPWGDDADAQSSALLMAGDGAHPPIPSGVSMSAMSFLLACFAPLPEDRPSASELLAHPFLETLDCSADTPDAIDDIPLIPEERRTAPSLSRPSSVPRLRSTLDLVFELPSQTARVLALAARSSRIRARSPRLAHVEAVRSPLPKRVKARSG